MNGAAIGRDPTSGPTRLAESALNPEQCKPAKLSPAFLPSSPQMNAFVQQSRGGAWHLAGLASSFPDIQSQDDCSLIKPHCKAFSIPKTNNGPSTDDKAPIPANLDRPGRELKDQVLVFKFKGKFHAIDHQCPHSAFPLSRGSLFDIEDFGITLSAGITCPQHDWSFDLFSGQGDRGNYKLKVWEVQLRDPSATDGAHEPGDQEVWVRRKQRIG